MQLTLIRDFLLMCRLYKELIILTFFFPLIMFSLVLLFNFFNDLILKLFILFIILFLNGFFISIIVSITSMFYSSEYSNILLKNLLSGSILSTNIIFLVLLLFLKFSILKYFTGMYFILSILFVIIYSVENIKPEEVLKLTLTFIIKRIHLFVLYLIVMFSFYLISTIIVKICVSTQNYIVILFSFIFSYVISIPMIFLLTIIYMLRYSSYKALILQKRRYI